MNTYLGVITEDGQITTLDLVIAPGVEQAESLMRQAHPPSHRPVQTEYGAFSIDNPEARRILDRRATPLGYALTYRPGRLVKILVEVPHNVTDEALTKSFGPRYNVLSITPGDPEA